MPPKKNPGIRAKNGRSRIQKILDRHGATIAIVGLVAVAALILALVFGITLNSDVSAIERATVYSNRTSNVTITLLPGESISDALVTLQAGPRSKLAIIIINGNLSLGNDPKLDFSPLSGIYDTVLIQGVKGNVVSDTVQTITGLDPWEQFKQVTGLQTLTPNLYDGEFVYNVDQDLNFVVDTNTNTTIDVIGGNIGDGDNIALPPIANQRTLWEPGTNYELFTISSTITWSGVALLDIPLAGPKVIFEALIFSPDAESQLRHPVSRTHAVHYKACRLIPVAPAAGAEATYRGSMLLEGVSIDGNGDDFNSLEEGICFQTFSLLISNSQINYADNCYMFFCKAVDIMGVGVEARSAVFDAYAVYVDVVSNGVFQGFRIANGLAFNAHYIHANHQAAGFIFLDIEGCASGILRYVRIIGPTSTIGLRLFRAWVAVQQFDLQTIIPVQVTGGSILDLTPGSPMENKRMIGSGATGLVQITDGSKVIANNADTWYMESTGGLSRLFYVLKQSELIFATGTTDPPNWVTPASALAYYVDVRSGSSVYSSFTATNGPGVDVLLGGSGTTAWPTTSTNDLGAGTPQNVFFSRT